MVATFHGRNGHKTAAACDHYESWEQEQLGLGDRPELWCLNGQRHGRVNPEQVKNLGQGKSLDGMRQLRRSHPRQKEGEGFSFSLPFSTVLAMKKAKLLDNPKLPFGVMNRSVRLALKELNKHAFGRTTGGKLVKVDLYALVYRGYVTRAGQVSPELKVFILNMGRTKDGRYLAVHWPPLYRAQKSTQAMFHLGVAYRLGRLHKNAGIKCVPHRSAFRALGVDPKIKPIRTQQIEERLKETGGHGPEARAEAARDTRGEKPKVSWAEAVRNTSYPTSDNILRKVERLSKARQRKFARKCVTTAFRYCAANSIEFTRQDVLAAAAQIALPHVHPVVFGSVVRKEVARAESHGIARAREYPDGQVVYTSVGHVLAEKKSVAFLAADTLRKSGRLKPEMLVKALAARGYSAETLSNIKTLTEKGGTTFDDKGILGDQKVLAGVLDAYRRNDKQVLLVGKGLGNGAYSAHELGEHLTRTGHLTAFWRGMRSPGPLMQRLAVAEHIRKTTRAKIQKGGLVVADSGSPKELKRIAEEVRKAGGKFIVTGQAAKELAPRVERHLHEVSRGVHR